MGRKVIDPTREMELHLFHGRNSPDEQLEDWGFEGPTLRIWGFHVTYNATFRVYTPDAGDWAELHFDNDCLYYDGKWYGDWSIAARGTASQERRVVVPILYERMTPPPVPPTPAQTKAKIEVLMVEQYGLEPVEWEDRWSEDDTRTPQEFVDWFGEKYDLDRIDRGWV